MGVKETTSLALQGGVAHAPLTLSFVQPSYPSRNVFFLFPFFIVFLKLYNTEDY
jgi:hypothetical protein